MPLPRNQKKLRRLDVESYQEKSLTWSREKPVDKGVRISNKASFKPHRVETDGHGNVVDMPPLAGKPCFGIPTAFLRHGRAPAVYVKRLKERVHNSRCDLCNIRKACKKLVGERARYLAETQPEFHSLIHNWIEAGGLEKGGFAVAHKELGQGAWTRIGHFLQSANFSNSNDAFVAEHWAAKMSQAQKSEEGRARTFFRTAWKHNRQHDVLIEGLDTGRDERLQILDDLLAEHSPLNYLRWIQPGSAERICAIWWGREFLKLTGQTVNPNRIATCLIEKGRALGKSHAVLRSDAKRDLKAIQRLEASAKYNGGSPKWPKFRHPVLESPLHFRRDDADK